MYSQFFLVTREAWQLCSVPELTQPPAQSLLKPGEGAPGWRRRGTLAWEQKLVNGRNSPCESGPGSFLVLWEAASWKVRAARDQDFRLERSVFQVEPSKPQCPHLQDGDTVRGFSLGCCIRENDGCESPSHA